MKLRHELKHRINFSDIFILRRRLSAVLKHDSHAKFDGKYIVKSLYFDNYRDKALREKTDGTQNREKFRIRYYDNDTSFIRLEKKSKINGLCSKQTAVISKDECIKIINGDIRFLIESENKLLNELYAKMYYECLRPKNIVSYARESFVYAPGNVRVTIDTDIGGSYNIYEFLNPSLKFTKTGNAAVLEVKWDNFLPEIIRNLVGVKCRKSAAFSKYAVTRY